ncbi:MAG: aminomethyltransferase [Planctomycetota bacterium]
MSGVFHLPELTVVDLLGSEAAVILHNLTTNDVKKLPVGGGCETFITEVRGRTLAHVYAFRTSDGFRLIGAPGQADAIIAHADRYTIREDATPSDLSSSMVGFVLSPNASETLRNEADWGESSAQAYDVDWLGGETMLLLTETPGAVQQVFRTTGETPESEDAFHRARVEAGFPWYGPDISDKNLPQEISRIKQTISFTKGCYLGQEPVARLDALGRVQKRLMRWETRGSIPPADAQVTSNGKVVGKLTSIAIQSDDQAFAIGMARRSHFESGATAEGEGFEAKVLGDLTA